MYFRVLREHQHPRRFLVDTVQDIRPNVFPARLQVFGNLPVRAVRLLVALDGQQPRGLVDRDKVLVLVQDLDRAGRLAFFRGFGGFPSERFSALYGGLGDLHFVVFGERKILLRAHPTVDEYLTAGEQGFHVVARGVAFAEQKLQQPVAVIDFIRSRIDDPLRVLVLALPAFVAVKKFSHILAPSFRFFRTLS